MTTEEVLTRGVDKVLPDKKPLAKLMDSKKIRVYLGIDPTGPKLHLGHTIPLRKLQAFADLGHEAILVFGTGTVLAGDPSQRKEARKQITQKEIDGNVKDWKRQAEKVLNFDKIQIKFNGDWLLKLSIPELLAIESHISAFQLIKRDNFQERNQAGDFVGYNETLYPILQGYDSVYMDVDAEIGGTDQTFNMLIGRELQKKMKGREKYIITTPLVSGTDGKPMSKTSGNCVWLSGTSIDMYGKIMSISDSQLNEYWVNLTDLSNKELTALKPFEAKKKLAKEIVKIYHSAKDAEEAEQNFANTFQKGQTPTDVQEVKINVNATLIDLLTGQSESKSEAKRLLLQNAVEIDGETAKDGQIKLTNGQVVKIGKKKFVKIVIS